MTFTKQLPTAPGVYWRKLEPDAEADLVFVFKERQKLRAQLRGSSWIDTPIEEYSGEWCRLVPAEEIRLAWSECARCDGIGWRQSRAKRVMEGEE